MKSYFLWGITLVRPSHYECCKEVIKVLPVDSQNYGGLLKKWKKCLVSMRFDYRVCYSAVTSAPQVDSMSPHKVSFQMSGLPLCRETPKQRVEAWKLHSQICQKNPPLLWSFEKRKSLHSS